MGAGASAASMPIAERREMYEVCEDASHVSLSGKGCSASTPVLRLCVFAFGILPESLTHHNSSSSPDVPDGRAVFGSGGQIPGDHGI